MSQEFDIIIIGAGSAGCVMASRLSEDPDCRVLLLEAGGPDRSPYIHMPAGLPKLVNKLALNWNYYTEPQAQLENRRLWWPRGKVLGGSSSINAMCYTRGQPEDYDHWAALGNSGWSWNDVLPYFRKAEGNTRGADTFHGEAGPLHVDDLQQPHPLSERFINAGVEAGFPRNDDFNGPQQEGVGLYQVTQRDGRRCSTATAYLRPVRSRPNLTVLTGALSERILLDGKRAVGVQVRRRGRQETWHAASEVICCGGTINSPQLLMLSGIGDARDLKACGVEVRHDLPGVGRNLQDHLDVCTLMEVTQGRTYDMGFLRETLVGLQYFLTGGGIGTTNAAEAGGFVKSRHAEDNRPDIQLHFVPALLDDHGRNRLPGQGMTIHACQLRPHSRGRIRLRDTLPDSPPRIDPNYLSAEGDLQVLRDGLRIAREIFSASAFQPVRGKEIFPGASVKNETEIDAFIRRKAETIYHPAGTCRMGSDEMAVVDDQLRVRGIEGLRVVDASVMPTLVSSNTNAPVVMIAEKTADLIHGK
jgi:choline dehydrogenase